jgi:hypothetical protein
MVDESKIGNLTMCKYYKGNCCKYFCYPNHNDGVNLSLNCSENGWHYVVFYKGNKMVKEFKLGADVKQNAQDAVNYAIALKTKLFPPKGGGGKKQTSKQDPKVLELQRNINKYCNKKIKVDGIYGPETKSASQCISKDLSCLLYNGFKETTIGGPMTKRTVLEKEMNGTTYQIGFKNNEEDTKVRVVGNNQSNSEKICDWRCATGTPLGIDLIDCKKRRIEYY